MNEQDIISLILGEPEDDFTAQSPARTSGCDSTGCAAMPVRSCTIRTETWTFRSRRKHAAAPA